MSLRKTRAEKVKEASRKKQSLQTMSLRDIFLLLVDPRAREKRQYEPTQWAFAWDPAPRKAYVGPKGSAKTTSGAAAGFMRALTCPGSKGLVVRVDYNDLKQTTKEQFERCLHRLPKGTLLDRSKDPPEVWTIQSIPVYNEKGELVSDDPSTITFAGVNMLGDGGSYEFDWIFIDEASELETMKSVTNLASLLRNKPAWWEVMGIDDSMMYTIMAAANPTDVFHFLYTACTGLRHDGSKHPDYLAGPYFKLFTPVKGENTRNLPGDYYQRISVGMTADEKMRKVDGLWGFVAEGVAVYTQFKQRLHGKRDLMQFYDRTEPLIRGWDFGYRHPYVVYCQYDYYGRLMALKEIVGENQEIDAFVDFARTREKNWFPGQQRWVDRGDPAARQKKDTGSTLTELNRKGISLQFRIWPTLEEPIRIVRYWLEQLREGEPVLLFDEAGVPVLIRAMAGGYHIDEKTRKIVKDGTYDHPADGYRYLVTGEFGSPPTDAAVDVSLPKTLEYNAAMDPQLSNYVRTNR